MKRTRSIYSVGAFILVAAMTGCATHKACERSIAVLHRLGSYSGNSFACRKIPTSGYSIALAQTLDPAGARSSSMSSVGES
jgi:hypothetical protein